MVSRASKKSQRKESKRKTQKTRRKAVPRSAQSLSDELSLVHARIQNMMARALGEEGLSDEEWEEFWNLVDRKVQLIEAETRRELAKQNARLNAVLESIRDSISSDKTD